MKNKANLEKLHIGSMIKEIAMQKEITHQKITALILRYQESPIKVYHVNDMDCDNMVKISYMMEYNFLKVISEKYLSHIPVVEKDLNEKKYYMVLNDKTGDFKIMGDLKDNEVLKKLYVGHHLKAFADKNGWNEQDMAKLLHCSQSYISYLYRQKSMKVKKLLQISDTLKHNFIKEIYLDRMFIVSLPNKSSLPTITITPQEVRIENPYDTTF